MTHKNTLNASHVCCSWRSALASFPVLWNIIDITCMAPPLMQRYLDRPKASLECHSESEDSSIRPAAIRRLCAPDQGLIGVLSFEVMSWSTWKAISSPFSVSRLLALPDLRILAATKAGSTTRRKGRSRIPPLPRFILILNGVPTIPPIHLITVKIIATETQSNSTERNGKCAPA